MRRVRTEFPGYDIESVEVKNNMEIKFEPGDPPTRAVATFNVVVTGRLGTDSPTPIQAPRYVKLTFEKSGPFWRVVDLEHDEPMKGFRRDR